jgi:hypothetical protein
VRITMVTGVHHNEQPGDLEAGEGAHETVPLPRRGSSRRTPAKITIPGIRSGPVTSAKARETCQSGWDEPWRESIREGSPSPARSAQSLCGSKSIVA